MSPKVATCTLTAIIWISLLCLSSAETHAHVRAFKETNNRYLKVTLRPQSIRIAYTVFFGERPGYLARRRMDSNKDGNLSKKERKTFAQPWATSASEKISVRIDGEPINLQWKDIFIGVGTPKVFSSPFSVDFIAWLCLPTKKGKHQVWIQDKLHIPMPGETEVRIEESPGVHLNHSFVGNNVKKSQTEFKWLGKQAPLSENPLQIEFRVETNNREDDSTLCSYQEVTTSSTSPSFFVLAAATLLLFLLFGIGLILWRKRKISER